MVDEFEESEVVFEETEKTEVCDFENCQEFESSMPKKKKLRSSTTKIKKSSSVPIKIPEINVMTGRSWFYKLKMADDGGGGEMEPPHVIIGRRMAAAGEVMAFSVYSGNGRTLKGRDLSEVRKSILRLTGFLET